MTPTEQMIARALEQEDFILEDVLREIERLKAVDRAVKGI